MIRCCEPPASAKSPRRWLINLATCSRCIFDNPRICDISSSASEFIPCSATRICFSISRWVRLKNTKPSRSDSATNGSSRRATSTVGKSRSSNAILKASLSRRSIKSSNFSRVVSSSFSFSAMSSRTANANEPTNCSSAAFARTWGRNRDAARAAMSRLRRNKVHLRK